MDELARAVDGRPRWTIRDGIAVYRPAPGYEVRVRELGKATRAAERWHAALIVAGTAGRASTHYTAAAAVDWAERVRP